MLASGLQRGRTDYSKGLSGQKITSNSGDITLVLFSGLHLIEGIGYEPPGYRGQSSLLTLQIQM